MVFKPKPGCPDNRTGFYRMAPPEKLVSLPLDPKTSGILWLDEQRFFFQVGDQIWLHDLAAGVLKRLAPKVSYLRAQAPTPPRCPDHWKKQRPY